MIFVAFNLSHGVITSSVQFQLTLTGFQTLWGLGYFSLGLFLCLSLSLSLFFTKFFCKAEAMSTPV